MAGVQVRIRLHSFFAQWAGAEELTLSFSSPVTLRDVLVRLREQHGEAVDRYVYSPQKGLRPSCVAIIDGTNAELLGGLESPVRDGCTIQLIPPLSGGSRPKVSGEGMMVPQWDGVRGEVPGPRSRALMEVRRKFVPDGVASLTPLFAARAEGAVITDVDGNRFLDFGSGIAVLNVGSTPRPLIEAVAEQLDRYLHLCFHVVMYEPYVKVAERLCQLTPGDFPKKVFLVNTGAEAVENAVKMARKFTGRPAVITLENAFHGRTFMAMTLTSKVKPYKLGFGPFAPEVYRAVGPYCYRCPVGRSYPACDVECWRHLQRLTEVEVSADRCAAVIVEPVQGEGGFVVIPPEYLVRLREFCSQHGIVLIDDEVQTGWGRTGCLFGIEHAGIVPDILVTAKALAGGLPLGAVVAKAEIMDSVHPGGVGSTFGGNPLSCAAALAVMDMMESAHLVDRARAIGQVLGERLRELQDRYGSVGDVRGRGAMWAVEFVGDRETKVPAPDRAARVIEECYRRGLIVLKAGAFDNVVRLLPPLVISDEQLEQGVSIFADAVAAVHGSHDKR